MLDSIGTILLITAITVILMANAGSLSIRVGQRIWLAGVAGAWLGLAIATAAMGVFATAEAPLALLAFFALPLAAAALLLRFSPAIRSAVFAVPMPVVIGLNVVRAGGVLFVLLAAAGRLAGPFPYVAGWGDVITGVLALPVAWLATQDQDRHRRVIWAWNAFGGLDLLVAVTLAVVSRNGSPLQLIHAGVGSSAMSYLPWSLVPTFLVPYFLISHGVVFARLRGKPRAVATSAKQPNTGAISAIGGS